MWGIKKKVTLGGMQHSAFHLTDIYFRYLLSACPSGPTVLKSVALLHFSPYFFYCSLTIHYYMFICLWPVMANFMCQCDWVMGCPGIWSHVFLGVPATVFLEEMNI